ncbi:hypothetical protein RH915_09255 [Serpentinicella sp. ANB-PHB4]|uniref:hypothetical protein n=1 Tax=Serpentinicella sp. ANB-PHB4 TaxID=3074076 RepID=UPI00285E100A|nr:hypothetical protein [Serpentinicella sp. ANB-PHB4]MDR5659681.1 hypothetical protein [Serpentinicella sp. ANB-PHB4]
MKKKKSKMSSFDKRMLKSMGISIVICMVSVLLFSFIPNALFDYDSVEASYHLTTHILLFAAIATMIFCTYTIVEVIKNNGANNQQ